MYCARCGEAMPEAAAHCPRCGLNGGVPPERPANNLALAIVACILCALPAGIVAVVYASQVNGLYASGAYDRAAAASRAARNWALAGIVIDLFQIFRFVVI